MKTLLLAGFAPLLLSLSIAAEAKPLHFGGEKIGIPSLSLAESLAQGQITSRPPQFASPLPRFANGHDASPLLPNLLPHADPPMRRETHTTQRPPSPRVTRSPWGMPIIAPSDGVDYKLVIVPPDPALAAKMIIKDPGRTAEAQASK